MSRNTRFIWCILAAMLFCAVSYGGCGGNASTLTTMTTTGGDS